MKSTIPLLALSVVAFPAGAIDASDFDEVVGYTVAAVNSVKGDFEGCDFDKKIRFDNGWTLTCSSYSFRGYAYRRMP